MRLGIICLKRFLLFRESLFLDNPLLIRIKCIRNVKKKNKQIRKIFFFIPFFLLGKKLFSGFQVLSWPFKDTNKEMK